MFLSHSSRNNAHHVEIKNTTSLRVVIFVIYKKTCLLPFIIDSKKHVLFMFGVDEGGNKNENDAVVDTVRTSDTMVL